MTLLTDLADQALSRDSERGWNRQTVERIPEVHDPELMKPYAHAFLSKRSISVRDDRTRRIVGQEVADGELARLYLKRTLEEAQRPKVPFKRPALEFTTRQPAYHFEGEQGGPFELVDISACYASLYCRLALDLTYRPDSSPHVLVVGHATFPDNAEWRQSKGPRNALWGNLLKPRGSEWRFGVQVDDAYPNRYFAPDLTGIVLDAAHAIAGQAVNKYGAVSWAVDGGCFRPGQGRAFIEWLSGSFGLTATVRAEGPGWLFGATSYRVGAEETADVKKGRAHVWPRMTRLRPIRWSRWLADVFKERE